MCRNVGNTVLNSCLVSDGGTSKKKLEGRSDITLGGTDVDTGRGKTEE
jgi:hypothetical protein